MAFLRVSSTRSSCAFNFFNIIAPWSVLPDTLADKRFAKAVISTACSISF